MTSHGPGDGLSSSSNKREDGPFVLRPMVQDVPLSADGSQDGVKITCVEYFECNLYVGTSASELLHFVQIPPDPSQRNGRPMYILASRLSPNYAEVSGPLPGVQQILLLPRAGKACIRCNWTVTFYSLPELTPAFASKKLRGCTWIGGVDLNQPMLDDGEGEPGVTVLVSSSRRIQALQISHDAAQMINRIELPGINLTVRRDAIACVADSKSYSLLDVERQLKIPLMSISSMDESPLPGELGQAQSLSPPTDNGVTRSSSSVQNRPSASSQGHGRSTSLGGNILGNGGEQGILGASSPGLSFSPAPPSDSIAAPPSNGKPLPNLPSRTGTPGQAVEETREVFLKPHIASPTPEEFLVIRGTSPVEPCIGMFVNLDGDPTRPPITFERYPKEVVVDGGSHDISSPGLPEDEEGFVLASTARDLENELEYGLEIQPLDAGDGSEPDRHWLDASGVDKSTAYGIRSMTGSEDTEFEEIIERLCQRKFTPFSEDTETPTKSLRKSASRTTLSMERLSKEQELFQPDSQDEDPLPEGWEAICTSESEAFARRLAKTKTRLAVWAGDRIWWAVRNPLIVRFDSILEAAKGLEHIDRRAVVSVLASIRRRDAQSELEYLTLGYLRQKVGLFLLISLLRTPVGQEFSDSEMNAVEEVLVESSLDPRVVLSLIPGVRYEIIQGQRGIWIYGGVKKAADAFIHNDGFEPAVEESIGSVNTRILHFLRRFLTSWRGMKGLPSVSDESEVFRTVDAALMLVLLELDKHSPKGLSGGGAVRKELNDLVDKGVDCFERAAELLESYRRLYVLSRLYQNRKEAGNVLATWKRIVEGERDDGGEFTDGELRVREYLARIRSQPLVQEYGVWLANRNPRLGVQVFTEDKGRAGKFKPAQVIDVLREEAPDAVKYYLEHLVFGKGLTVYVNDLITYYLDVVVTDLESSAESREALMATYDAYRALQAPKPSYRHFLTDNTHQDDEVSHSRLRLLQLLSGSHAYDAEAIKERISSLPDDLLVPETISLSGRDRNHEVALRLLVHRLGDFDTAVSYCLRGGTSIDSFTTPHPGPQTSLPTADTQRQLFNIVLRSFLSLTDASDRIEQTGALLERFGGWFEVDEVLKMIPDSWSVDIVANFLMGQLRRLVSERREGMVVRALSGSQNLQVSYEVVKQRDAMGPSIEAGN